MARLAYHSTSCHTCWLRRMGGFLYRSTNLWEKDIYDFKFVRVFLCVFYFENCTAPTNLNDCDAMGWSSGMDCLRFCWTAVGSSTEVTPSHGKMNCLTEVANPVATAFPQGTFLRFHTSGLHTCQGALVLQVMLRNTRPLFAHNHSAGQGVWVQSFKR